MQDAPSTCEILATGTGAVGPQVCLIPKANPTPSIPELSPRHPTSIFTSFPGMTPRSCFFGPVPAQLIHAPPPQPGSRERTQVWSQEDAVHLTSRVDLGK